jgi:hypothetical protein
MVPRPMHRPPHGISEPLGRLATGGPDAGHTAALPGTPSGTGTAGGPTSRAGAALRRLPRREHAPPRRGPPRHAAVPDAPPPSGAPRADGLPHGRRPIDLRARRSGTVPGASLAAWQLVDSGAVRSRRDAQGFAQGIAPGTAWPVPFGNGRRPAAHTFRRGSGTDRSGLAPPAWRMQDHTGRIESRRRARRRIHDRTRLPPRKNWLRAVRLP